MSAGPGNHAWRMGGPAKSCVCACARPLSARPRRASHACAAAKNGGGPASEAEEQDDALRGLPGLGRLLYGAASRLERGASTCLNCKGTGSVDCAECGASGLTAGPLKGGGRRGGLLSRVVGKVKSLAGRGDTAGGDAAFVMSNRCRRCHGLGRVPCTVCGGLGVRATVRRPGDLKQ